MRRRDFLRFGVLTLGGYSCFRRSPRSATLLIDRSSGPSPLALVTHVDEADIALIRGDARIHEHTVSEGQTLRFDPKANTTLELTGNLVVRGTLEMKPDRGVKHTIRFVGIDESRFVGGGMDVLDTDVGLWVMGRGKLDIRGEERAGWNRSGTHPTWKPADEILTTPMSPGDFSTFAPYAGNLATVTGPDGRVFTQEAFNLTRTVRIEGTPTGRTHVFIRSSSPQKIKHAQIRYVGPRRDDSTFVLGRYGLHFHMCGDGSRGSRVKGTVVRDCGSHAFVPHTSHGVTFRNCVAYDVNEDAYWWDGGERTDDTSWIHCLAAKLVPIPDYRGYRLAGFNLGVGHNNRVVGSVVAGNQGNKTASGFTWPEGGSGLWLFQNCVAHNNKAAGIFVWQNNNDDHVIEDYVAYRNALGIYHGSYNNLFDYERCVTFENGTGVRVDAVSKAPTGTAGPLRWSESTFADGVLSANHNLPAGGPASFIDTACASVLVDEKSSQEGGAYDFVRTGLEPSNWTVANMHPSSVYRVQRADGTAYQVTADGTTVQIPSFA